MRFSTGLAASLAVFSFASAGWAHIDMTSPDPRSHTELKSAPCGPPGNTRSATPTYYSPGDSVTIHWDETVDHPSHYRIMLDMDGSDFSDPSSFTDTCDSTVDSDPICIADDIADGNGGSHEYTFNLPTTPCDNCTIQLIQVMTDKPPYGDGNDIYHACADIVISTAPDPTTAAASSASHAAAATSNAAAATSGTGSLSTGGAGGAGDGGASDGCSISSASGSASGFCVVGLAAMMAMARRKKVSRQA